MSNSNFPFKSALLVAALMQALSMSADAAKPAKDAKDDSDSKVCDDCPDVSGWSGTVEGGLAVQSKDDYHFGRYTGYANSGASLVANGDASYRGPEGKYANIKAVDLGVDSRDLVVGGGKQGSYGIEVEYDQIPNYRKQLPTTDLKTERDRTGAKFSLVPEKDWEVTGHFRHETKDGTRDVGATFNFGPTAVLAVPFNYQTDDFGLEMNYKGAKLQAQVAYAGSLFKNGQNSINWTDPATGNNGRIAEAPDNQSHQISGLLGYQLSDATRIGAKLALGRMTQNESFLPSSTGVAALPLPASSLDGKVDTTLAGLDINSRPTARLRLDASYTYSNRDNTTPVNTYNYVNSDVANTGVLRQNQPYSFEQKLLRTKVGYKLPKEADLSAGFDIDQMSRTYQQVEETKDNTGWAKLKLRPMDMVETTLKYSYSTRTASSYSAAYQNPQFPESANPLMKAFELADRNRDKIGLDVSITPTDSLSLAFNVDYYKDDYKNMALGLTQAKGLTTTPSLTYSFSDKLSGSAYFTYEKLNSDQAGLEWIQPASSPLNPNLPWFESDNNVTKTTGLSLNWKAIPKKLEVGADVVYSTFTGKMQYASPGTDLPNLTSSMTAVGVRGTYQLKDNVSLRASLWYERYQESDWANANISTVTGLGVAPQNFETYLLSLSARYEFK